MLDPQEGDAATPAAELVTVKRLGACAERCAARSQRSISGAPPPAPLLPHPPARGPRSQRRHRIAIEGSKERPPAVVWIFFYLDPCSE